MATILLVDDVELFLELEKSFLNDSGHQLITAGSGEEALELMQTVSPDLLLLDLYLSGIDGDEVCRRLRSTERWATLPIIMVSAAGQEEELRRCLAAGCDDYLTKPVNKKDLTIKIQRLLDRMTPRNAPRVSASLGVQLKDSQSSLVARTRDISRNGIFIESINCLDVGTIVTVHIDFAGNKRISRIGIVKRVEHGSDPGMGIYFIHPELEGIEALEDFLSRQPGTLNCSEPESKEQDGGTFLLLSANQKLSEENLFLEKRVLELENENREFAEQLVNTEDLNNNLINLYVASSRMHSVLEWDNVIDIIKEVVINFVGVEQFALLLWDEEQQSLNYSAGEGFDPDAFPTVSAGEGLLGEVFAAGEIFLHDGNVANGSEDPLQPLAAIPLVIHGEVIGVLAIYHLLTQKEKFEPVDHQLFSMLAEHAATALFSSKLYDESERKRQTYRGMMDILLK